MTPEDADAIAERIVSRIGFSIPSEVRDMIRTGTTQQFSLHYISKDSIWYPLIRMNFTDNGVWFSWEMPNGSVLANYFLPWGGKAYA